MRCRLIPLSAVCLLLIAIPPVRAADKPLEFRVTFDKAVSAKPFTGRVYVMLTKSESNAPRFGPSWFKPEPIFARDVKDWKPGDELVIDGTALAFPDPLAKLPKAAWSAQAVMDFDRGERNFSTAPGNGYSKVVRKELDAAAGGPVALVIDQVVPPRTFKETERVKLAEIDSKLLTDFHKRPVKLRAGVVLPKSFATDPKKHYPVVYEIPGFGGTHESAARRLNSTDVAGMECLWVVLDPSCRLGHHVFADSANNGPCGRALVEELAPAIEKQFRGIGVPAARFVTGHSSGGWSSLWLQVTYPDFFGGVWSTAPDPVDFRDFQRVNVYRPGVNMFLDDQGDRRPIARSKGKPTLFYQPFSDMDRITGHGGQLDSFDAVFGPRGADGRPVPLWDRDTGALSPAVAKHWEKYDIRLTLENNWKTLGPKLTGKLHVIAGSEDTFYLDGAVVLLKESLTKLGSDAVVEVVPGRDHGNLIDAKTRERMNKEMAEAFRKNSKE
jgi:pimeloyl-ACP methyl ester carboxylesterase